MIRNRFNECALCQFPDGRCDEYRYRGTGYCEAHLSVMRVRRVAGAVREVPASDALEALEVQRENSSFCESERITEDSLA